MLSCFSSHSVALPQSLQLGSLVTLAPVLGETPVLKAVPKAHTEVSCGTAWLLGDLVLPQGKARALGVLQNRYLSQQPSEQSRMTWNSMQCFEPIPSEAF